MSDPIRDALRGVANIIECTHDTYNYSNADIVALLCCIEEKVLDALRVCEARTAGED